MRVKTERGQALIIFAVALVGLLAFVALAIDIGRLYVERRNAQSAADSAAFAAAVAKIRNEDALPLDQLKTAISNAAIAAAQNDGFPDGTVITHYPPLRPGKPYDGDANYVQVVIKSSFTTFFVHIFGRSQIENTSEAVVLADSHASFLGGDLIWGASPTDCQTVSTNGTVTVNLTNGNLFDNSAADGSHPNCDAMDTRGSSGTITATNGKLYVVGSVAVTGHPNINPTPIVGMPHKNYPVVPAPDCSVRANFPDSPNYHSGGNETINNSKTIKPGIYNNIKVNGGPSVTLTLQPGLYCINGDFTVNGGGTVEGSGVMLAFFGGMYDLGGSDTVNLTAPLPTFELIAVNGNEIDYAGMLIYANPASYTGSKTFQINGDVSTNLVGAIYAPTTGCSIQGNVGFSSVNTQLLCDTVSFGGNNSINMALDTSNPFEYGGNIRLMQ